jgi:hypothetical protein
LCHRSSHESLGLVGLHGVGIERNPLSVVECASKGLLITVDSAVAAFPVAGIVRGGLSGLEWVAV